MKINFQEVSLKATRRWKENGKTRQETKKFYQTINPFNRDKVTGLPKTRNQIWEELKAEREAWLAQHQQNGNE